MFYKRKIFFLLGPAFPFAWKIIEKYCKCSKILNTFLFLFLIEMHFFKAEMIKMLVRIANREDPDQTASLEAV